MKMHWLFPLGVLALVLGVWLPVSVADDPGVGGPEAVWEAVRYEFPAVLEGQPVTHDFTVRNRGSEILEIQTVKTS